MKSREVQTSREFTLAPLLIQLNRRSLDLSFNNIRHAPKLTSQTRLRILYLVQNKISVIEEGDLDWAAGSMTSLELGGNRLRRIENLEKLVRLEEIWLGKNKIRTLEVCIATCLNGLCSFTESRHFYIAQDSVYPVEQDRKVRGIRGIDQLGRVVFEP